MLWAKVHVADQEAGNNFAIAGAVESLAFSFELKPELASIDEIAVVCNGDVPNPALTKYRLCVSQRARSGSAVSVMADRHVAGQRFLELLR